MGRLTLDADLVKRRLAEPWQVLAALGLTDGAKRLTSGSLIRCPWHVERSPSCSVRVGADGTLAVHCFGCGQGEAGERYAAQIAATLSHCRVDVATSRKEANHGVR